MRELCIEEIAMSTRVALPMFVGCRMSELRRHLVPSPTPSQDHSPQEAQVRRNLFGPIDHDENLKFVQNELTKITQSDCKKWNFDFEAEKPQEGRFNWEPIVEGVPQAYEMPRLNYLSSPSTKSGTKTTPHNTTTTSSSSSPSSSSTASSSATTSVPPSAICVPECSTTTTTAAAPPIIITSTTATSTVSTPTSTASTPTTSDVKPTFTKTSISTLPSCSSTDTKSSSEIVVVRPKPKQCNNNTSDLTLEKTDLRRDTHHTKTLLRNRTKSSQPPLTAFMKIRKSKRAANTKLEDDQPPALVKRSKTTTS